jgi:hypothetical protein
MHLKKSFAIKNQIERSTTMKTTLIKCTIIIPLLLTVNSQLSAWAQGNAFTYQGHLNDASTSANGSYDLTFTMFGIASGGNAVAGPITNSSTGISNGLFTVTLNFGAGIFPGADRWLEISARTNGTGVFTTLSPRQKITPTPYAITASNVTGVVSSGSLAGTYSSALTLNNAGNSFTGNGAGLTSLNANNLASGTVPAAALGNAWKITGNAGTTPGTHFIGTTDNQALDFRVNNRRGFRLQPNTNGAPTVIGGSSSNLVSANVAGATIGGGDQNFIQSFPAAESHFATISGGSSNFIDYFSFNSTIGGGFQNSIGPNDYYSTIAGGLQNRMDYGAAYSIIAGGHSNTLETYARYATIGGGEANTIGYLALYSTVGGGWNNTIRSNAQYSVIGGGNNNTIQTNAGYSSIVGGSGNTVVAGLSSIVGGGANFIAIGADFSVIAGGGGNTISSNASYAFIGGGNANTIQSNADNSTIGGGLFNQVQSSSQYAFIGGGDANKVKTNAYMATIAGGSNNTIDHDTSYSFIGGGKLHVISPNAAHAVIAGGDGNTAAGEAPAIGGGTLNVIETGTTYSSITGGGGNRIVANSFSATIAGGYLNQVNGNFSFAAGNRAQANHPGTFAWAGGNTMPYASIFPYAVNLYASNGVSMDYGPQTVGQPRGTRYVYIGPINSGDTIGVWNGAHLTDGGVWSNASDKNRKTDFKEIDTRELLEKVSALPVRQWRYTNEIAGVNHLGPTAQDFKSAFGLGTDDKSIGTVDADGVALAAIQGLNQKLEETRAENAELRKELSEIKELLTKLSTNKN